MNDNSKVMLTEKKQSGFLISFIQGITGSLGAILLALLIGALVILLIGKDPVEAYRVIFTGAFGNKNGIAETLLRATPLALVGLGASVAFSASVFNVGTEGQLFLGATASAAVALALPDLPRPLLLLLMAAAACLTGALLGGLAVYLKIKFNANEMINTIMMNYVIIFFVSWLMHGPLQQPGSPLGQTAKFSVNGILPVILKRTRLHAGFIVLLILVLLTFFLLRKTVWGYQIKVTGKNIDAAYAAGIPVNRILFSAIFYSGALAGLAGMFEASGIQNRMIENISSGYGYTGIVVALLGQLNPVGVFFSAVFFGALQVGASSMETKMGIPSAAVIMIQYLIVILFIGRKFLPMMVSSVRKHFRGKNEHPASDHSQ